MDPIVAFTLGIAVSVAFSAVLWWAEHTSHRSTLAMWKDTIATQDAMRQDRDWWRDKVSELYADFHITAMTGDTDPDGDDDVPF